MRNTVMIAFALVTGLGILVDSWVTFVGFCEGWRGPNHIIWDVSLAALWAAAMAPYLKQIRI